MISVEKKKKIKIVRFRSVEKKKENNIVRFRRVEKENDISKEYQSHVIAGYIGLLMCSSKEEETMITN